MDIFHKNILPLLEQSGKNDIEIEKELGLSRSTIYDWRIGKSKSYTKHAGKLAKYFGVSTDFLLDIKNNPSTANDELNELLELLATRPDMKMFFNLAKGAKREDVEKAVKIIETLLKD